MTTIIHFDICAVVILAIIAFSMRSRKMTNGTVNRIFLALLGTAFAAALFDIWSVILDNTPAAANGRLAAKYISNTGYLLMHNLTSVVYLIYIIALTDTWHKLRKNTPFKLLFIVPYAVQVICLSVNPFTQLIFRFDADGHYKRGTLFPILYICAFALMILCQIYLLKYKRLLSKEKFATLFAMFPLQLAAVVVQWINPGLLIEMLANAIGLLYVTISVQRPEEIIDSATGLRKYSAYAADMKRNFSNGKKVSVILINTANYMPLHSIVNYDGVREMLKKVADELTAINKETKAHADLYYLDRGRFRFVIEEEHRDKIKPTAEKVNSALKHSIIVSRMELNLIAYVCTARCPEDIGDFEMLMEFGSDFHEKTPFSGRVLDIREITGKNTFILTNELDKIIDDALANKNLEVYYQPIYSIPQERFVSAEALLRIKNDKYGFISPELFIPAAEKSGAIHKIGDYVFEEVCRFISSSDFKKLELDYIEVNLSVAQCMQTDLADKLLQIMRRYNVSPSRINLEITETAANYAQNIMTANIDKLAEAGISFSLDDYGTGYSNIRSVASLPLEIVKLDKSFVDVEDNPRMLTVLEDTIKMLKDMDMHIVVEGVETKELLLKFADLKCEYIQGYYFSKPIPRDEFVRFISSAIAGKKN